MQIILRRDYPFQISQLSNRKKERKILRNVKKNVIIRREEIIKSNSKTNPSFSFLKLKYLFNNLSPYLIISQKKPYYTKPNI